MKAKLLLPIAAIALPMLLQAKPAWPGMHRTVNPHGSTVVFRVHGDEHFSYITDADGMLMKRDAAGSLIYELKDGARIKADRAVVSQMYQEAIDRRSADTRQRAPQRMAVLDDRGRTTYPTIGSSHSLVVLVEFSDVKFQPDSPQDINNMLNMEGYSKYGSNGSVRDYYRDNSGGLYTPVFDVSRIVTLPNTSQYYAYNPDGEAPFNKGKYDRWLEAIEYALNEIDGEIDFSDYDCDGDGIVDTVYFIYAGYGQADTPTDRQTIWPHQWNVDFMGWKYDGVTVGPYACSNELNGGAHYYYGDKYLDGLGTFVHEFGHVLGMPDLYSPEYKGTETTPGVWDVMDGGSYNNECYCPPALSAYEKWLYRWLDYTPAEDGTSYSLKSTENGGEVIRIPIVDDNGIELEAEYFLLESRRQTNWDSFLPDEGLLIWHIEYNRSKWEENEVNVTPGHPCVYLLAADGTANPHNDGFGNPGGACWPGCEINNTFISPDTDINFHAYAYNIPANPLNVFMTSIAYDAEHGVSTFDYNIIRETPRLTCNMLPVMRTVNIDGELTTGFVLQWEPAEAANGVLPDGFDPEKVEYEVTIYYMASWGGKAYVLGYYGDNRGSDRIAILNNLSPDQMSSEYHAFIRPVFAIPSATTSKEIVFIPNEVKEPYTAGIEAVGADGDSPVYGIEGGIVAPQGAEVYTLSGLRVGTRGLAPGLYIVRLGATARKVLVR